MVRGTALRGTRLEPTLFVLNIRSHKVFIRLREIDNSLDDADDTSGHGSKTTSQHGDQEHNNSFRCVAQKEFVNSEAPQKDRHDPGGNLFVRSH